MFMEFYRESDGKNEIHRDFTLYKLWFAVAFNTKNSSTYLKNFLQSKTSFFLRKGEKSFITKKS